MDSMNKKEEIRCRGETENRINKGISEIIRKKIAL